MTHPVWVLGIKFELFRRASILTHSAIFPVQVMISKSECQKPEWFPYLLSLLPLCQTCGQRSPILAKHFLLTDCNYTLKFSHLQNNNTGSHLKSYIPESTTILPYCLQEGKKQQNKCKSGLIQDLVISTELYLNAILLKGFSLNILCNTEHLPCTPQSW